MRGTEPWGSLAISFCAGGIGETPESDIGSKPTGSLLPVPSLWAQFLHAYSGNGGGVGTALRRQYQIPV